MRLSRKQLRTELYIYVFSAFMAVLVLATVYYCCSFVTPDEERYGQHVMGLDR